MKITEIEQNFYDPDTTRPFLIKAQVENIKMRSKILRNKRKRCDRMHDPTEGPWSLFPAL